MQVKDRVYGVHGIASFLLLIIPLETNRGMFHSEIGKIDARIKSGTFWGSKSGTAAELQ